MGKIPDSRPRTEAQRTATAFNRFTAFQLTFEKKASMYFERSAEFVVKQVRSPDIITSNGPFRNVPDGAAISMVRQTALLDPRNR
jgi:hypothetical protein